MASMDHVITSRPGYVSTWLTQTANWQIHPSHLSNNHCHMFTPVRSYAVHRFIRFRKLQAAGILH